MIHKLSPGNRVIWLNDFEEVRAQVTRVYKNQAQILTSDFQKIKVPLDELELVPVRGQTNCPLTDDQWNPDDFGECDHLIEADGQVTIFLDPDVEPPDPDDFDSLEEYNFAWFHWKSVRGQTNCPLTDELEKDCPLTDDHWIEEKMIKRAGKLHGPYRYERWRDEKGKKRSKYLGKKSNE